MAPPIQVAKPATGIKQTIQARHGVATYVPAGYTIKIINTYGRQVVDTWAFALHGPPEDSEIDKGEKGEAAEEEAAIAATSKQDTAKKEDGSAEAEQAVGKGVEKSQQAADTVKEKTGEAVESSEEKSKAATESAKASTGDAAEPTKDVAGKVTEAAKDTAKKTTETAKGAAEDPKETAGQATASAKETAEKASEAASEATTSATTSPAKKSRWSSYVPSLPQRSKSQAAPKEKKTPKAPDATDASTSSSNRTWTSYLMGSSAPKTDAAPENVNSAKKGWGAYIPSGASFSSYVPTKDALSAFAGSHYRDPNKSYAEQLFDFSKTPVGAGTISVATGSGYAGSIYAAYKAYETTTADKNAPSMEYMSMMHTRATTLHLSPRVGDTLISNLRAPLMTVVEDTSPGVHDTLIAACDPQRYRELGAEKWEEHGSCAENCVMALREINQHSGLKGRRAIGADVTVNTVPAPLNLFMNIPWTPKGDVSFEPPKTKKGDAITLKAERDVVVVMSACPQDILSINGHKPMVCHFVVESGTPQDKKEAEKKKKEAEGVIAKAQRRMSRSKSSDKGAAKKEIVKKKEKDEEEEKEAPKKGEEEVQKGQEDEAKKGGKEVVKNEESKKEETKVEKKKPKKLEVRKKSTA